MRILASSQSERVRDDLVERKLYAICADNYTARLARMRHVRIRARIDYRVMDDVDIEISNADLRQIVHKLTAMSPDEMRRVLSPSGMTELAAAILASLEHAIDGAPLLRDEDAAHFNDTILRISEKMAAKSERFGQIKGKRA